MTPTAIMIFAAGFGTRMGELTENQPKPMIKVAGKPLIDHALALTDQAGLKTRVINLHYHADQLETHLKGTPNLSLSYEDAPPLETGGGLKKALPLLGHNPVLTLNPDVIWTGPNPLTALAENWRPNSMDGLLTLVPVNQIPSYKGFGDFTVDRQNRISRATNSTGPNYLYCGAQILRTEGLAAITDKIFSLNILWDQMISSGTLYGHIHTGGWADVGTPAGIKVAEKMMQDANV